MNHELYRNARMQSDFFCEQFHKMLRRLIVTLAIILLLILSIIYMVLFEPGRDYYCTTTTGKIIPMGVIT
ncbi:hypothetical protein AYO45_04515 [Gammaproteobacteria bacterium SCGC AG-212-F23]|nr:hypothetical protein AYO45_04515 [Gammaproteobacteria bacterium SCGC AG-212-F23]